MDVVEFGALEELYCKAAAVAVWVSSPHHWRACFRICLKSGAGWASSSRTRILARVRSCSPSTKCRDSKTSLMGVAFLSVFHHSLSLALSDVKEGSSQLGGRPPLPVDLPQV